MSRMCKIIPAEVADVIDGSLIVNLPNGEQYKVEGGHMPMKKGSLIKFDKDSFLKLTSDVGLEIEEIKIKKDDDLSKLEEKNHAIWHDYSTRILIDLYKELRPQVGISKIKTLKNMWEQIALQLKKEGFTFDYQQCESKWKSLVRSYRSSLLCGSKRRNHYQTGVFEEEIGQILSKQGISFEVVDENENDEDEENSRGNFSESSANRNKTSNIADDHTVNLESSDSDMVMLNRCLARRIAQKERLEKIKIDQRERLINAIEERNQLLKKIFLQRDYKAK